MFVRERFHFLIFISNADRWNTVTSHCILDELELLLSELTDLFVAAIYKIEEHRVDGVAQQVLLDPKVEVLGLQRSFSV